MEGETTVILRQRDAERQREPIGELRMRSGPVLEQYRDTRWQATARCIHPVCVTSHDTYYSCLRSEREQPYLLHFFDHTKAVALSLC